jgi:hypothetical protein
MPIYGDEKRRQMARSTLPSTSRKGARDDLRNVKQHSRACVRQNLRVLNRGFALAEDVEGAYDESSFDWNQYPDTEIRYIMYDRRDREKLGPALRWAPSQVEHLRIEDRLSYMYTIMPDTVAGRHAVGHIGDLEEFEIEDRNYFGYYYSKKARAERYAAMVAEREVRDALVERLEAVRDANLVARFNEFCLWEQPHEITEDEFYEGKRNGEAVYESPSKWYRYSDCRPHRHLNTGDFVFIDPATKNSWVRPRFYRLKTVPLKLSRNDRYPDLLELLRKSKGLSLIHI